MNNQEISMPANMQHLEYLIKHIERMQYSFISILSVCKNILQNGVLNTPLEDVEEITGRLRDTENNIYQIYIFFKEIERLRNALNNLIKHI